MGWLTQMTIDICIIMTTFPLSLVTSYCHWLYSDQWDKNKSGRKCPFREKSYSSFSITIMQITSSAAILSREWHWEWQSNTGEQNATGILSPWYWKTLDICLWTESTWMKNKFPSYLSHCYLGFFYNLKLNLISINAVI